MRTTAVAHTRHNSSHLVGQRPGTPHFFQQLCGPTKVTCLARRVNKGSVRHGIRLHTRFPHRCQDLAGFLQSPLFPQRVEKGVPRELAAVVMVVVVGCGCSEDLVLTIVVPISLC